MRDPGVEWLRPGRRCPSRDTHRIRACRAGAPKITLLWMRSRSLPDRTAPHMTPTVWTGRWVRSDGIEWLADQARSRRRAACDHDARRPSIPTAGRVDGSSRVAIPSRGRLSPLTDRYVLPWPERRPRVIHSPLPIERRKFGIDPPACVQYPALGEGAKPGHHTCPRAAARRAARDVTI